MVDLSSALNDAGFETPRTYLQSGNAVAGYPETDATIVARDAARAVAARIGFQTTVVALDEAGLADLARESVRASFASPERKTATLAEIDSCAEADRV